MFVSNPLVKRCLKNIATHANYVILYTYELCCGTIDLSIVNVCEKFSVSKRTFLCTTSKTRDNKKPWNYPKVHSVQITKEAFLNFCKIYVKCEYLEEFSVNIDLVKLQDKKVFWVLFPSKSLCDVEE